MDVELGEVSPCSSREFYWNFAYSENDSVSGHGDRWRSTLGSRLSRLIGEGARSQLTATDWTEVERGLEQARGGYATSLMQLRPDWYRVNIGVHQLAEVRVINHQPFLTVAPGRRLDDFVAGLDAGMDTPGDPFAQRYRRLRPLFQSERVRGVPILVARRLGASTVEVDGLTRMSILLSKLREGDEVPGSVELLMGISEHISDWRWF